MTSKPSTPKPPFEIPLSDHEIMMMGKVAIIWGQIDEALNRLLVWALKLSPDMFDRLLGKQMIGVRVGHLKSISTTCTRPEVQERILKISKMLTDVLPKRNAAMHGCWGRFVEDPTYSKFQVGTFNHQKPKVRFFADEIPTLYQDLCRALALLEETMMYSIEFEPEPIEYNQHKIYFAPRPPDKRAYPVRFERGDKVINVTSDSNKWKDV